MLKRTTIKRHTIWLVTLLFMVSFFAIDPLLIPTAAASVQASYYVSPTGSDSNPGTESAPFKTITKARDVVRSVNGNMTGDIYVYLRGGNYSVTSTINFEPRDSGTNGYRIYYQAYPGEKPVLNGATKVTGWTQHSGNIYKASLNRSTKLRNLYVNDQRALMTSKKVTARGGYGTYSVTAGQASWAWTSGSKSDGVQYYATDVPAIARNKDDLEIVNGTTWNENIVCTRDVITSGSNRVLLLQQPYGAIAQTPGWGAAFSASGSHTIYNAFEFLNSPGQFYFDKTTKTLYYYIRPGENMATADVQAPIVEKLIDIAGTSTTNRVKNITFQGITFANTDYNLVNIAGSHGKSTCQAAQAFVAFYNDNWHNTKYDLVDTLPGMINVSNSDSIDFISNIVKHSGSDGINMPNDVINSNIIGNYITDITSSGITVGHPQHVYIGNGGNRAKYPTGVEGVCKNNTISNNMLYDISTAPGFGGCAAITAYFVDTLEITYNHVQKTAYNGIHLGWGWCNFTNSTTCKNNTISYNRVFDTLTRLHDSGAIYTIGQMPGTNINENYVRGIPPATWGPTYGLHNDEGTAYINENDNVLDIDPGVKYTINCEDFGQKHDLTILRTYATVNKMGINPPNSRIDPITVVPDNVWPLAQYNTCLNSGIQEEYRSIIPDSLLPTQDYVFPASCATAAGTQINIRSSGNSTNTVWFAPAGTTNFVEGPTMTKAAGNATSIAVPASGGTYKLCVVNSQGIKLGESTAQLRVSGPRSAFTRIEAESYDTQSGIQTESCTEGGQDVGFIENGDYAVYDSVNFGSGAESFQARVASDAGGGNIEIRLDSITGPLVGTCKVTGTGGWQTWADVTCDVSEVSGTHDLYLKFTGDSGYLYNLDWWKFTATERSAFTQNEAEGYDVQSGIQTEDCSEGGQDVGFIENGDYAVYSNIDFGNGAGSFKARVASATEGGNIEIRLDSITGPLVGTCKVTGTGGWQTWSDVTCNVSGASGTHDLYLKFTGSSGFLFNLNWWKFSTASVTPTSTPTSTSTSTPTPTPTGVEGDVNGDGNVNSIDFALLRLHLLGTTPLTGKNLSNADVNGDGNVNSIDFALVRQYLLGIISSFN